MFVKAKQKHKKKQKNSMFQDLIQISWYHIAQEKMVQLCFDVLSSKREHVHKSACFNWCHPKVYN